MGMSESCIYLRNYKSILHIWILLKDSRNYPELREKQFWKENICILSNESVTRQTQNIRMNIRWQLFLFLLCPTFSHCIVKIIKKSWDSNNFHWFRFLMLKRWLRVLHSFYFCVHFNPNYAMSSYWPHKIILFFYCCETKCNLTKSYI